MDNEKEIKNYGEATASRSDCARVHIQLGEIESRTAWNFSVHVSEFILHSNFCPAFVASL